MGFYSRAARKHSKWVYICLPSPRRGQDQCGPSHFVLLVWTAHEAHYNGDCFWSTSYYQNAFCTVRAYNVHKTCYAVSVFTAQFIICRAVPYSAFHKRIKFTVDSALWQEQDIQVASLWNWALSLPSQGRGRYNTSLKPWGSQTARLQLLQNQTQATTAYSTGGHIRQCKVAASRPTRWLHIWNCTKLRHL